ncbi:MAG: hypothetical protein Q4P25_01285 [Tissierellia bacterium]|nr:hypothetical protein [Tissierellia bacterium]
MPVRISISSTKRYTGNESIMGVGNKNILGTSLSPFILTLRFVHNHPCSISASNTDVRMEAIISILLNR